MSRQFLYYAGLVLTILGLIGIISKMPAASTAYLVFGFGLMTLLISFLKQPKK